jgi:hypothetical protein
MATFDLKEGWLRLSRLCRGRGFGPGDGLGGDANRTVPGDWLLSVLLCLALAAPCPAPARPWVLAGLLSLSGLAWLGVALMRAGPPEEPRHLTAWDAALLAFAASFGVQSAARLGLFGA